MVLFADKTSLAKTAPTSEELEMEFYFKTKLLLKTV